MSSVNLHSPERQLIELRIEHADLNAMIDRMAHDTPLDELLLMRMKNAVWRCATKFKCWSVSSIPKSLLEPGQRPRP